MPTENTIEAIVETILSNPPSNESTTCLWVVNPLLLASGYSVFDIYSQHADSNGQFPDYTILPDSPYTWFLEAKAWNVSLQDSHAQQSLNYANTNGRPWVVLTNGKVWRLYDNTIQGLAKDKFVIEAHLENTNQIKTFLNAISKASMMSGGLDKFTIHSRLSSVLAKAIFEVDSKIIKVIYGQLKSQPGFHKLSPNDVVQFFREITEQEVLITAPILDTKKKEQPDSLLSTGSELTLNYLYHNIIDQVMNKKPKIVIMPDGNQKYVKTWREFSTEIVMWFAQQYKLPSLPFPPYETNFNTFLNSTPINLKGSMKEHKVLTYQDLKIYMDVNRSARNFIRSLVRLCKSTGTSLDDIKIVME
jgi:predicted type IV restriction endonuclease